MTKVLHKDFQWGFATASYQIEGSAEADGRGPSIWDTFCKIPGKISDGSDGSISCDSYNHTSEDIALLKSTGAKAYRFSISWSRIIPLGGRNDPINPKGISFYKTLVDSLLAEGITPFVTIYHWDLPDALEKRYEGLLNKEEFVKDFEHYCRLLFEAMPKVKHWINFNEPWCTAILGYNTGIFAPGRTSDRSKSAVGDSCRECWIVGHNLLIAHGTAVKIYREEFRHRDDDEIGITLNDPSDPLDIAACERKLEFSISWFADPIYRGDYPTSMRSQLGNRLPTFTPAERALVQGSNDFYGMNTYTANCIRHKDPSLPPPDDDFLGNLEVLSTNEAGDVVGPETQSSWLRRNPQGFHDLLLWISTRYGYPKIYGTENGTSIKGENELNKKEILEDEFRVEYFRGCVGKMVEAIEEGVDCRGYFAWSLMDNFERVEGCGTRFGCAWVDFEGGMGRVLKRSGRVMGELFKEYMRDD